MKPHIASLINAVTLIVMSLWAYLSSSTPSLTALIPAIFGLALVAMYPGIKKENKVITHIAVTLTLLLLFALVMPLKGAILRADTLALTRIGLMIISTVFAMVSFIKSFIDVRKARANAAPSNE